MLKTSPEGRSRFFRDFVSSPLFVCLIVAGIVSIAILELRRHGHLQEYELKAYDWSVRLQPIHAPPQSLVTIVSLTERDIQSFKKWPLSDGTLAAALTKLVSYGPRAIGVDIYRDFAVDTGAEALADVLQNHANIFWVAKVGSDEEEAIPAPAVLRGTEQVGFNDTIPDRDGVVRRGLLFLDDGQDTLYAFPLRLALAYLEREGIAPSADPLHPDDLRLGKATFPRLGPKQGGYVTADMGGYQILMDYPGALQSFPSFSMQELLAGRVSAEAIRDKIVLIGVTAVSVKDSFHTPYSSGLLGPDPTMYGVRLHAIVLNQLLRGALEGRHTVQPSGEFVATCWIILAAIGGSAAGVLGRSIWRFLLLVFGGTVVLVGLTQVAFTWGHWIPLVPPLVGWFLSAALLTPYMYSYVWRERGLLKDLFSRHVSAEIVDEIWRHRDQFFEGGRPRSQNATVTVLFSDLAGFTPVAEKLSPQGLMDWINRYMEIMAGIVIAHGGVVDDYFGDAIKADFGIPLVRTTDEEVRQDARHAVDCALAMEQEMIRLNREWQADGAPMIRLRIGIYTGSVVAGSLGSANRLKYTTLGDTVNTAARLETYDKDRWQPQPGESPCRILAGESTHRYLSEHYQMQYFGDLELKGKEQKVSVHRILTRV